MQLEIRMKVPHRKTRWSIARLTALGGWLILASMAQAGCEIKPLGEGIGSSAPATLGSVERSHFYSMMTDLTRNVPELRWFHGAVSTTPELFSPEPSGESVSQRIFGAQSVEFDRTACSLGFLDSALRGKATEMILPQTEVDPQTGHRVRKAGALSEQSVLEIQQWVSKVLADPKDVPAMQTFLALHDTGKTKALAEKLSKATGLSNLSHDELLREALKRHPEWFPSFEKLSPPHRKLILEALDAEFELAQLVQGENAAANIA